MNNVPSQPDQFDGALVAVAVDALRHFGAIVDRDQAERLLSMWRFAPTLSETERDAVLRHFDPPAPMPAHDGAQIGTRHI